MDYTIHNGDVRVELEKMPAESVQCVVTSPPYFGLRDYGVAGQLGMEATPGEYVAAMVDVFRAVRRVLRDDGTLWLNLGDSYAGSGNYRGITAENVLTDKQASNRGARGLCQALGSAGKNVGVPPKNLLGIPWRVALALQADGWILRQDIIWHQPNPMPESVLDRCTSAHEHIFLLTKRERYFYDASAIAEQAESDAWHNSEVRRDRNRGIHANTGMGERNTRSATRNKRDVWSVPTSGYSGAHFATFPPTLIEPCILAGTSAKGCCTTCGSPLNRVTETRPNPAGITGWRTSCQCDGFVNGDGDPMPCTVLDPFLGSGTTMVVALRHGRNAVGVELNQEYVALAERRIHESIGLLATMESTT